MTRYEVVFALEAQAQLVALFQSIAQRASVSIADKYAQAIVDFCEDLSTFPNRGVSRDDVRPGLKTLKLIVCGCAE